MAASFFDSNALLYLASADAAKAARAEELIAQGGLISMQVLNEIANVARRKMRLEWAELNELLGVLKVLLEVRPLTVQVHEAGVALAERHRLSIYDAMIVAAALDAGCTTLWSEDMRNGLVVDGRLRIVDPFQPAS